MELDHGYLTIARITGKPDELLPLYRRSAEVMNGVGRDHGLLVHAAAATEDGLVMVNVWPSPDGSEAAARDPRRLGVLAEIGVGPDQMAREHHPATHVVLFDR
jgi:hypothetical protein